MMAGSAILIGFCSVLIETSAHNGCIPESACRNLMSFTLGFTLTVLGLNIMSLFGVSANGK